jgi:hypothetical protein
VLDQLSTTPRMWWLPFRCMYSCFSCSLYNTSARTTIENPVSNSISVVAHGLLLREPVCLLSLRRNESTRYNISCLVFVLVAGGTDQLNQLGQTDWAFYVMSQWRQSPVFETLFWIKTWRWIMFKKLVIVWMYHHHILLDLININTYIT